MFMLFNDFDYSTHLVIVCCRLQLTIYYEASWTTKIFLSLRLVMNNSPRIATQRATNRLFNTLFLNKIVFFHRLFNTSNDLRNDPQGLDRLLNPSRG